MKSVSIAALSAALCTIVTTAPGAAHEGTHAADHAPIGVMGDHSHDAGEIMFSYRFMHMDMGGSRIGTDTITPDQTVTTVPNRFFGAPMQPPTLRIVPTDMRMDMHMFGAMYAPTDWVTLMAMGSYVAKEMDHVTYQGGMGTTVLGGFTTDPQGFGDTTVGALFPLSKDDDNMGGDHEIVARAAVSLPTGSTTQTDQILTPMGGTPTVRLPYPMQLGSGTYDLKPAITYRGNEGALGWGAQYNATIRLGDNDRGYALGDIHEATAWISYEPAHWISFSGRVAARTTGAVEGIDPNIVGPVQTANPDFHGGERIDLFFGVTLAAQGDLDGQRLAIEVGAPVHQDLNGPQMDTNWTLTVGWQGTF